ncbi:MAG: T9SS type A sorting domain-containing protein [Endomicrobiia bacterium]
MNNKRIFETTIFLILTFSLNIFCATGVEDSYAFPVPCYISKDSSIKFTNLPKESKIEIYTLNGEKILTFYEGNYNKDFQAEWKFNEHMPASDVYIYVIKKENESKAGKIVVIK